MGLQVNQEETKMLTQSRTRQRGNAHTTVACSKFVATEEFKYLGQYWSATITNLWKYNGKLWQPT
jgi:hypothetical protein